MRIFYSLVGGLFAATVAIGQAKDLALDGTGMSGKGWKGVHCILECLVVWERPAHPACPSVPSRHRMHPYPLC